MRLMILAWMPFILACDNPQILSLIDSGTVKFIRYHCNRVDVIMCGVIKKYQGINYDYIIELDGNIKEQIINDKFYF